MQSAARRLFNPPGELLVIPAPTLETEDVRERVSTALSTDGRVVVFLRNRLEGRFRFRQPSDHRRSRSTSGASHVPAWIYVFDVDSASSDTPNPIVVQKVIATDADSIAHYAVKVAPEFAIAEGGAAGMVATTIRRRLGEWWPALAGAPVAPRRRRRPPRTSEGTT
jgi:hypothetical protein